MDKEKYDMTPDEVEQFEEDYIVYQAENADY